MGEDTMDMQDTLDMQDTMEDGLMVMPTMERKRGQLNLNPRQTLIPIFFMEDTMDMRDTLDMQDTMEDGLMVMPTMERKRGQLKLNPKQKLKLIPIFFMQDTMGMQDTMEDGLMGMPTMASMCKRPEESQNNLSQFSITSCKVYLHRSSYI